MGQVIYDSSAIYISSAKTLKERLVKIDQIILALYDTMLKAAATDNIEEYWLNDGQTIIRERYTGTAAVERSLAALEKQKQMILNQLNGRIGRLVDSKNFKGC